MSDILTMVWKEAKDVFFQGGWKSLIRPLFVVGIMGIYLPLQFGPRWVDLTPIGMLLLLWIPFFVIISFIGDVIAVFVFGIIFALQAVPANVVSSLTYSQFLLIAMAVIAVLDAIFLGLSLVSFQRSRLILS